MIIIVDIYSQIIIYHERSNHLNNSSWNKHLFGILLLYCNEKIVRCSKSPHHPRVKNASNIRQQVRYGGEVEVSSEKQKILDEADEYLQNHAGIKYLNRVRSKEFLEQKVKEMIQEKTEEYERMKQEEEKDEEIQKIK